MKNSRVTTLTLAVLRRAGLALCAGWCATALMAQTETSVTIGKETKKTVGVVTSLESGDVACYINLKDEKGTAFSEMADFDICTQKPSLVGKRVKLGYAPSSVMADSCQGNPDCKKTRKVLLVVSAKALEAGTAKVAVAAAKQGALCSPAEKVIFSCRTGAKVVSVCASADASKTKGYLDYRFGKPDAGEPLEINLPLDKTLPNKAATGDNMAFAGGGASWLRFTKGQYGYVVYSGIGRWGPKGETREKQGLVVERGGKTIANLKCTGELTSELGPDWFSQMAIGAKNQEFDLPD